MKAQETVNKYKDNRFIKSSDEPYCYYASDNEKVLNLFYHSAQDTIEKEDGRYFFVFDDKSSVEYDGNLFVVNDNVQTEYRLSI
jgi:hypothetical protein